MPKKKITDATLKNLKAAPAGKRDEIMDLVVSGFGVRVNDRGRATFILKTRYPGTPINSKTGYPNPVRRALGEYPAMSLEAARAKASQWLELIKQGRDPKDVERDAREAEQADRANSFEAVSRQFVSRYLQPKNRSWKESARQLGLKPTDEGGLTIIPGGLVEKWAGRKISDIRKSEVIAVLDGIVDRGKPIMANRVLAVLRKMFNWAVSRSVIDTSPCTGIQAPAAEVSRDRVLTDDELKAVWCAADDLGYPFGPLVQLLILTGQRRDEVAGMTWDELDIENRTWKLPRGRVKNDNGHEVPLSEEAIAVLEEVPRVKGSSFVFSTTGRTAVSGFTRAKDRLDIASGVPEWRLHDLRRTATTGMARLGIAVHVAEAVLNHKSGTIRGVAAVYNRHTYAEEKRNALDVWGRFVSTLVNGAPTNVIPIKTTA
ncbi:tyrosine-type recombinase/integrase [Bauldia litoralis]|uniref:tyrosine-type recombinase/integrase n=1 Tax=Bauldia litoralis TaxID=665467 RepID=UPI00326594CF